MFLHVNYGTNAKKKKGGRLAGGSRWHYLSEFFISGSLIVSSLYYPVVDFCQYT